MGDRRKQIHQYIYNIRTEQNSSLDGTYVQRQQK